MTERGNFQRTLDRVANWHRQHQGTVAGTGVTAVGAGAELIARADIVAIPTVVTGAVLAIVSSGVDYINNVLKPSMERALSEDETTVVSLDEIRSL